MFRPNVASGTNQATSVCQSGLIICLENMGLKPIKIMLEYLLSATVYFQNTVENEDAEERKLVKIKGALDAEYLREHKSLMQVRVVLFSSQGQS